MVGSGREEARFAEASWETTWLTSLGIGGQAVDGAACVIHQQQVVGCVLTETDHPQRSVCQFTFLDGLF